MKRLLASLVSAVVVAGNLAPVASATTIHISNTGPDSHVSVSVGGWGSGYVRHIVNNNNVNFNLSNWQHAQSGDATVSHNTHGGDATTGDASNNYDVAIDVAIENNNAGYGDSCDTACEVPTDDWSDEEESWVDEESTDEWTEDDSHDTEGWSDEADDWSDTENCDDADVQGDNDECCVDEHEEEPVYDEESWTDEDPACEEDASYEDGCCVEEESTDAWSEEDSHDVEDWSDEADCGDELSEEEEVPVYEYDTCDTQDMCDDCVDTCEEEQTDECEETVQDDCAVYVSNCR